MLRPLLALLSLVMVSGVPHQAPSEPSGLRQVSETGIRHGMLILGADTQVIDADGKILRTYPLGTRDGFMLPNGNLVLAITRCDAYPGGAAVEVDKDNKILFEYKGTQNEVNTVQKLPNGRYMLTEAGTKPRILEVDSLGFLSVEGLYWAMDAGDRDPANPQFTDHYFTGDYPTRLLDREIAEGRNDSAERQLSLLVSA